MDKALADADDRHTPTQGSSHPICLAEHGGGANAPHAIHLKDPGNSGGRKPC
jgi:hypothetical protein